MEGGSGYSLGSSEPVILLNRVWVRQSDFSAALHCAHTAKASQCRALFEPGYYKSHCITKIWYIGTGFIIMVFYTNHFEFFLILFI